MNIYNESVFVLPEMLPPSIIVMPTSPDALASPNKSPDAKLLRTSGRVTKKKEESPPHPLTRAASSSMMMFLFLRAADSGRTNKGSPAVKAASRTPISEKITLIPKQFSKKIPTGPFLPKRVSKI